MHIAARVFLAAGMLVVAADAAAQDAPAAPRHVVLVLADDLGSGDLGCYNPASKVATPHVDAIAAQGLRFTDAHSPSSVCSPTRYGVLTGRYAWRSRLEKGVLDGYSRALIEPDRATIASVLQGRGFATGCFGKWHLGLGAFDAEHPARKADYGAPFDAGPQTVGFATSRVIPASLDMAPYVWVRDGVAEEALTAVTPGGKRRWDGGPGFWRAGPIGPEFRIDRVLPDIGASAVEYVHAHAQDAAPFFLYVPLSAPHTPWLPGEDYQGTSGAGWYGDFVAHVDAVIGGIAKALDDAGIADETLLIVTSDNGAHWRPQDVATFDHDAHLGRRGMKADVFEAGHRVPLIVRGPGVAAPGTASAALVGLVDLFATVAELCAAPLPDGAAPDSVSFAPVLRGTTKTVRTELVMHSADGMFALRAGSWKLVDGLGSGGFTAPARRKAGPGEPPGQLFDLAADPAETTNRYAAEPEIVARLRSRLAAIRADGVQTGGADRR